MNTLIKFLSIAVSLSIGSLVSGDESDKSNRSVAKPPESWRAETADGEWWINIFKVGNGYRYELFPKDWTLGRAFYVSKTLIPNSPSLLYQWKDGSTLVILRDRQPISTLKRDSKGKWSETTFP